MKNSIRFEDLNFASGPTLKKAHEDFLYDEFCIFRNLITPERADYLLRLIFEKHAGELSRRDFNMPASENTPRHMSVINGHVLNAIPELHALHNDPSLLKTLTHIVRGSSEKEPPVLPYSDPLENMVATRLSRPGDTHGMHYDDPSLALIICLEAPPENMGGTVEFMRHFARGYRHPDSFHLEKGDGYLMRTDEVPHRVTPLLKAFNRSILNLTYHQGKEPKPNGSAELLFGAPHLENI